MKTTRWLERGSLGVLLALGLAAQAAEGWTEYRARPGLGSKVTIEGTSTVHDWTVEGLIIGGAVETGPNFPLDFAKATPGKVEAKVSVSIPVRSLKSMKEGKPYSTQMDDIMYGKLKMEEHKNIEYKVTELTLKEAPKAADGAFVFDAQGDLTVGGASKKVSMPVEMKVMEGNKLKFSGKVGVKMTDFGIEPPAPTVGLGLIKTGDEVKLGFDWVVVKRQP